MPLSPPSICTAPDCGTLVHGGGRCPDCQAQSRKDSDSRRPNGYARGWTAQWATFSKRYLDDHPICESETHIGMPMWNRPASTDVDHIDGTGRRGTRAYDTTNLQALCHSCHSRKTATKDGGFGFGFGRHHDGGFDSGRHHDTTR